MTDAKPPKSPSSLRRRFITPEGVDLGLELGGIGDRASAFVLDALAIILVLIGMSLLLGLLFFGGPTHWSELGIVWLLGAFVLRNFWFTLFEIGSRAATPGKRLVGLRVVARDGARLTGGAVIIRNAMREIELFLPLSFLGQQAAVGIADVFLPIFAFCWVGIFLFFPLLNRDRSRIGDLLAGTWVVRYERREMVSDLEQAGSIGSRRKFTRASLELYGVLELQTLEDLIRRGDPDGLATVAGVIQRKAQLDYDPDALGFLTDYYAALCEHLEKDLRIGRRRQDKHSAASSSGSNVIRTMR